MKKILLILSFVLFHFILHAQIDVRGVILDEKTNQPIPGATIIEEGTSNGTTTDTSGSFEIRIKNAEQFIVISFLGYESQRAKASSSPMLIKMKESSAELDELVVTALGLERSTKDLGYAVQKLETKKISTIQSTNFTDNLAGKVAGVTVSHGATGVGSSSKINIRGEASFTNNNPLFVVDGTPINNNSSINFTNEAAAGFQEVDFGNGAMEINAEDIESVTVLKGPNAAALYGTRASNGVIVITTKTGENQQGIGVSVNSSTFIDRAFQLPQFQNKYGQGNSGEFEFVDGLGGGTNDNITYSWGPALDAGILIPQFDSPVALGNGQVVRGGDVAVHGGLPITATPFTSNPDNLKDFYRTGITTINNIAISSGTSQGNYRLSFTDLRNESIIPGVNLKRKTANLRMVFMPIEKLRISSTLQYVNSNSDNRPAGGYGSENINYSLVAWGPRSMNIQNLEDYWQPGLEGVQQYSYNYTFFDNPYFILMENKNAFNRDRVFGNIVADYRINDQLNVTLRTGMDYSTELRTFSRAFSSNRFTNGAYAEQQVDFRENNTDILIKYSKEFKNISFELSAGANRMDQEASSIQNQALTLAQPGVFKLSNAASPLEVFDVSANKRINSVYSLMKLGYKNTVFIDITGRNDWSSALATTVSKDNVSFFYPSLSAAFILSNTVKLPEAISFVKLRGSWAQVGNDTDPYQNTGAFIAQTPYNSQPTFSAQNTIANGNLLPEKISGIEWGADVRFFDDRLQIDATYYRSITENQIISLPVAASSGYTQQVINGGEVISNGIEIVLGIRAIDRKNFKWNNQLNFNRNVSRVNELPNGAEVLTLAYSRVYDNVNQTVWFQVEEGGQIGDMYGTGYLKNENGDFVIDSDGNYIVDNNLQKLGNYNPDFILGFNNQFQYKKWNASVLLDWRQGGILVSRTLALAAVGGQLIETEDRPEGGIVAEGVVNVGTEANPIWEENTTAISAESYYRQFYDRNHEENNVYDATYLKLRELSIGYTFSSDKSKGFLGSNRQLTVTLIGRNLYAWSEIPHFDPEQLAVQGQQFISGVEDMSYATSRSYGIKLGYNF